MVQTQENQRILLIVILERFSFRKYYAICKTHRKYIKLYFKNNIEHILMILVLNFEHKLRHFPIIHRGTRIQLQNICLKVLHFNFFNLFFIKISSIGFYHYDHCYFNTKNNIWIFFTIFWKSTVYCWCKKSQFFRSQFSNIDFNRLCFLNYIFRYKLL